MATPDAGDTWSENGVSLFAVMLHFIDDKFELNSRLGICKGLGEIAHTGENIRKFTLEGLVSVGVADDIDSIADYVHLSTVDEGSNMQAAWKIFEGACCVCHREQNCLGAALKCPSIIPVVKKVKSICAHFHRSDKVRSMSF